MSMIPAQRLAIWIDAHTGGAVTEMAKFTKTLESEAVAADRTALANAKLAASNDLVAKSTADVVLANAKNMGGGGKGSAEALALSDATAKANLSKKEAKLAADQLANSELKASAETQRLGKEAGTAGGLLSKMGKDGGGAGQAIAAGLAKVGPAIAVLAMAKVLTDGIKGFQELTGQIRMFQNTTGASAKNASLLIGQVNTLGIDSDLVGKAMFKMTASIGDGSSKLGQYGIEVAKTKAGNLDAAGTLDNVRRAYNDSTDAARKDAIAKAVGARGGAALLPLLRMTTDEINRMNAATKARGGVYAQDDVEKGYALKVASTEMGLAIKGLEISLAKGVVPALTEAAGIVTQIVNGAQKLNQAFGGKLFSAIFVGGNSATDLIAKLTGATKDNTKAKAEAEVQAQKNAKEIAAEAKAEDDLTKAVRGEYNAQHAAVAADKAVESAKKSVISAQLAYDKLLRAGAVDQKAVTAARKEGITADRDAEKAVDTLEKAQQSLAKAIRGATDVERAQANLNVAEGPDKIAKAREALAAAQEKMNALQGSGSASASELTAAQNDINAAVHGVEQAEIDQAKAAEALTLVKQKGTAADPAVIAAQEAVANARDGVTAATERQRAAAAKLRTDLAGDPDFATKLALADDARALAAEGVKLAEDHQMQAAFDLHQATDVLADSLDKNASAIGRVREQLDKFPGYAKLLPPAADLTAAGAAVGTYANTLLNAVSAILGTGQRMNGTAPLTTAQQSEQDFINSMSSATPIQGTKARAAGGPVDPGSTYLINEHGNEYLRMGNNQSGYITPTGMTPGGNGGTTNIYLTTYVTSGASANEIARDQAWTLNQVRPPAPQGQAT